MTRFLISLPDKKKDIALQTAADPNTKRGERMAAILQRMADRNALSHITDPTAWQREVRKDRPLPGRE